MIGQTCNLETVQSQEIPIKVGVKFYIALPGTLYEDCGKRNASFLKII